KAPIFARYLLIALLAKLMLESGIVKFTSFGADNANTCRDLTALDFHYWTQPLPHGLSPWIDSLPWWFDQFSLISMYGIELILPILLFFPGNLGRIALLGQIILQITILLSGNYGFFNLLTICLCIPLIDDQMVPQCILEYCNNDINDKKDEDLGKNTTHKSLAVSIIQTSFLTLTWFFFGVTTYGHLARDLKGNQQDPIIEIDSKWTDEYMNFVRPTRAFNSYGLFRVMTTTRPEIIIEGSLDGKNWRPYAFKYKPTDPKQTPRFAGFHMPRIDWQMWFEGLNYERYADHPFSRMLYHKFLSTIALGGNINDFRDIGKVIGQNEYQAFIQSPPHVQQRVLQNFNALLHAFNSRSLWFGEFLEAIFEHRLEVMEQLAENLENLPPKPNFLRISLAHYQFSQNDSPSSDSSIWDVQPIEGSSLVIER
ncbi:MAG: lipase maturation factor family protein, partial [Opitutales bacterium]